MPSPISTKYYQLAHQLWCGNPYLHYREESGANASEPYPFTIQLHSFGYSSFRYLDRL